MIVVNENMNETELNMPLTSTPFEENEIALLKFSIISFSLFQLFLKSLQLAGNNSIKAIVYYYKKHQ